jgi:hypothetical protein
MGLDCRGASLDAAVKCSIYGVDPFWNSGGKTKAHRWSYRLRLCIRPCNKPTGHVLHAMLPIRPGDRFGSTLVNQAI